MRLKIHAYALHEDSGIEVPPTKYDFPGLLRTSRALRHEALRVWYEVNTFLAKTSPVDSRDGLHMIRDLGDWLKRIGANTGYIRKMRLYHTKTSLSIDVVLSPGRPSEVTASLSFARADREQIRARLAFFEDEVGRRNPKSGKLNAEAVDSICWTRCGY